MNMLEHALMSALSQLLHGEARKPSETLATREALDAVANIDPERCRGLVIIAVQDCKETGPKGEPGLELVSSMTGRTDSIMVLLEGARALVQAEEMKRHFGPLVAADPVLSELLGGSAVKAETLDERYSAGDKPQH